MASNQGMIICMFIHFAILSSWHTCVHGKMDCHLNQSETDQDAGIPREIFPHCRCNTSTKRCYNEISWKPPSPVKHNVIGYLLSFFDSGRRMYCYQLPKDARSFIFNESTGFAQENTYTFTLTAQPVNGRPQVVGKYIECPIYSKIDRSLKITTNVSTNHNHIYKVYYVGIPEPVGMWKFSRDIVKCSNLNVVDDAAIKITTSMPAKDKYLSTLEITKVTKAHEGCYTFHIENYFSCVNDFSNSDCNTHGILTVNEQYNQPKKILGPVLGGVAGSLLFIVFIAFIIYRYFILDKRHIPINVPKQIVYMSHCATEEKEKDKLLKFATSLQCQISGLTVIIDLTSNNEINSSGGMPQWVPEQMEKANKIIVVLSKLYLEKLNSGVIDDNARKIHTECNHIRKVLYESRQRTSKLVIVSDHIPAQEFPDIFQGQAWYSLPSETNNTLQYEDFGKIVAVLSKTEVV